MKIACLAVTLALVTSLLSPNPAHAQPAPSASSADASKRAEAFFKQGIRLYSDKKWAEAEAAFRSAWEFNRTYDVAYNVGSAAFQQGKYVDAAQFLSFALRHWPLIESAASLRQTAEQRLKQSRAQVASLTIQTNVPAANVLVDDKIVGTLPLEGEIFIAPGLHVVEVQADGYKPAKEPIQVPEGAAKTLDMKLVSITAPAPVTTNPPPTGQQQPSGTPDPYADRGSLSLPPDDTTPSRNKKSIPLIAAGIGLATAGLAVGVGSAITSANASSFADQLHADLKRVAGPNACGAGVNPKACDELYGAYKDTGTFRNVSIVGFVVGGAAAIATVVYVVLPMRQPAPAPANQGLAVVAAPGHVSLVGKF